MRKLLFVVLGCLFNLCVFAQNAVQTSGTGKVVLDNQNVKVTLFEGHPGKDLCGIGKHSHGAHLTVLLTESTVTVTQADGKVVTQKASVGTTFWSEAETHMVINSGKEIVKAQIIEYKKLK
jgi:hypothetical protein